MKFTSSLILSLVLALSFVSCKKKNKGEVTFTFQMTNDDGSMALNDDFINDGGNRIVVEKLWFYLGDITFIDADNNECLASDIELFKMGSDGTASITFDAPHGNFTKIKFGLGVPQVLNDTDPSEFTGNDHPLNVLQETHWGHASQYRFCSIEGRYDIEPDDVVDGIYAYHTGFNEVYSMVEFEKEIGIEKNGNTLISFEFNVEQLLDASGNSIDVVNESFFHGSTDMHLNEDISTNWTSSVSIQ